jgi:lambda family phage tail tape measure protein
MGSAMGLATATNSAATASTNAAAAATNEAAALDNAASAANKTAAANDNAAGSFKRMGATVDNAAGKLKAIQAITSNDNFSFARDRGADIEAYGASLDNLRAKFNPLFAVIRQYKSNIDEIRQANAVGAISTDEMSAALSRQRQAALLAIGAIKDRVKVSGEHTKATGLEAHEMLNFTRQMSDVTQTLALGMSPMMVLIEQGPQIADVFQSAAARGVTFSAALKSIGASAWAALAPLLPIIIPIGAAIGVVAAAFGLAARRIRSDTGDVTKSMDLTKKQTDDLGDHIDKLKGKKIDVEVTTGDTFKAFFVTLGQYISEAAGNFSWLKSAWNDTMDFFTKYGILAIKAVGGSFAAGFAFIKASWSNLPSAFGDIFVQAANEAIKGVNWLINKVVDGINSLGGHLQHANLGQLDNPFSGASKKGVDAAAKSYDNFGKSIDGFGAKWEANAVKIAKHRILKDIGPDHSVHKDKKQADPWGDLINGANKDIDAQKARAAAAGIDMTAEAAATLEEKTKLLSEAQSKGIMLTAAMRGKIDELAGAYGRAKVAADNAVGLKDTLKLGDKDIADIKSQIDMIGLYGRQLAYASEMAKLLAEEKSKGMTPDAIAASMPQLQDKANQYADASAAKDAAKFMEDQRQDYMKNTTALEQQAAATGLSADETTRLGYEQKYLNDAVSQHIALTPEMVSQLMTWADQQAATENAIRGTKEALDFTRDAAKGFVSDLRTGLEQGENLFKAFGNAVLNVLNKVADKLVDLALDSALGGGGSGVGGFLSSIGKVLGIAASGSGGAYGIAGSDGIYAKGSAFNGNGVVNTPTAFAYGRGGSMSGIMGEAGDEAVMPLVRGSDGSLGVQSHGGNSGSSGGGSLHIVVTAEEGEMFRPIVRTEAAGIASTISQAHIEQYDNVMPQRVNQINGDQRVR